MSKKFIGFLTALTIFGFTASAQATILSHDADDAVPPLAFTPGLGTLTDAVGTFFIDVGVDYSFGNEEGIFDDPPGGFCGINGGGICDLLTDVDGRIVIPGTTDQGLTSFIMVEAGISDPGALTLTVFDTGMSILATTVNGAPVGPNGRQTMTIDRGGVFDIAFFSISGGDSFGVNYVEIEMPAGGRIPEPASLAIFGFGLLGLGLARRRRKTA